MYIKGGWQKNEMIIGLNDKCFGELTANLQSFMRQLFPKIKNSDVIYCKRINSEKADLEVKVNHTIRRVVIKTGQTCCVHKSKLASFVIFLNSIGVSKSVILSIIKYHYGDDSYDGTGNYRYYKEELKLVYAKEIAMVNKELNKKRYLSKIIDYVLINDRKGLKTDFLYYGTFEKGAAIRMSDLKNKLMNNKSHYPHNYLRIGPFNYQVINRNIHQIDQFEYQRNFFMLKFGNFYKYVFK